MFQNSTVSLLIGAVIFAVAVIADDDPERTKRSAPNINVHQIPKTGFSCNNRKVGEYYADPEANCQVYHVCVPGMHNKMSLISFVCPNGTIFSQATRVCTPYERVDCSLTIQFYETVHGDANSRRTDYVNDNDVDNYVPQPPPSEPAQPPRQPPRSRNTPVSTSPPRETPAPQPRNTRFRTGSNQFRGQQAPPATTAAPIRTTTTATARPARPASPVFRPPALPIRPAQPVLSNVLPPRVTHRPIVSTSTSSYNYEYEYEYDYEDETPTTDQGSTRSKREAIAEEYDHENVNFEETFDKTAFNCLDKVAGGVYADIESNCEIFHICVPMGKYKMLDYKVFCANGTAFDQETGSCRGKEEFNCENALLFFQFERPNPPASSKKPILKKKKYNKSKKAWNTSME